jgi:hypothetical protein
VEVTAVMVEGQALEREQALEPVQVRVPVEAPLEPVQAEVVLVAMQERALVPVGPRAVQGQPVLQPVRVRPLRTHRVPVQRPIRAVWVGAQ